MSTIAISEPSEKVMPVECKHPKVKIVARDEDAEYVECAQCGEVFESSEFRDMQIEESTRAASEE